MVLWNWQDWWACGLATTPAVFGSALMLARCLGGLGSSKDTSGKREGLGASSRSWGAGGGETWAGSWERPQMMSASVSAPPLTCLDKCLHLSKPHFPHLQNRGDNSTKYGHFYFLPPVAIYLSLAPPLMLIWASSPIHYDIVSTPDWVVCVSQDVPPATVIFSRMGSRSLSKPMRSQTWAHDAHLSQWEAMRLTGTSGKEKILFPPCCTLPWSGLE